MANTWYNTDGLYIKYGTSEATAGNAGESDVNGAKRVVDVVIPSLPALSVTAGGTILDDNTVIPAGARIESIEVLNETAATSAGSPTLDFGLIRLDRTTELDYNGFVAAQAMTSHDAAGEKTILTPGSTAAGALIGTTLAFSGLLTANYNTAVYTAGKLRLKVVYYFPTTNS